LLNYTLGNKIDSIQEPGAISAELTVGKIERPSKSGQISQKCHNF